MGSFFSTEICDLLGLYALNHLKFLYKNNEIGLYRDNGLAIIEQKNNQTLENTKKRIIKLFNKIGFEITIDISIITCYFLDKTQNLTDDEYKPYRKENSDFKYINKKSNHPIVIKKNLPEMIEKKINRLSKSEKIFKNSVPTYQNALNDSNFKHMLIYSEIYPQTKKKRTDQEE